VSFVELSQRSSVIIFSSVRLYVLFKMFNEMTFSENAVSVVILNGRIKASVSFDKINSFRRFVSRSLLKVYLFNFF